MNGILRLGMVGCGEIARFVALLSRLNRRIQVVACCDRSLQVARDFAARHKITRAYTVYEEMLEQERLDAAYIAVPHDLHFDMVCAAIEAGLHILVEKPIAPTLGEGIEMAHRAEAAGVCVGVNYQYRYDSGCYALAMAIREGWLGQAYYGRCNIPWHRDSEYFEHGPWRGSLARAGGGTLLTQGSHALDILIWALDSPPESASGIMAQNRHRSVEVEDTAMGMLEMANGALAQVSSSMVASPEQAVTIEVYGERGTARYSNQPIPHVRFRGVRVKKAQVPVRGIHALQRSLEAFRAWVCDDKPFLAPARESLPVLAAIDALYRSAESGQREHVHDWGTGSFSERTL